MATLLTEPTLPSAEVCERALAARDARFDGIFFVGITSTKVYCRPVCPSRVSRSDHRRFFHSAASAERAGFRPCLRCRPELAPGRATVDAVPRLALVAADRIRTGALNGHAVADLAQELGVSDRHLRRAMERSIGVSPMELAQTHRLLLAKHLLTDTSLSVTRIAFASGFQSLRRFNSVFRERYRLSPSAVRRASRGGEQDQHAHASGGVSEMEHDLVRLTLSYRPPLAWAALTRSLARDALPGVESVDGEVYRRTVRLDGLTGIVRVESSASGEEGAQRATGPHLDVAISPSLLPALMPLLARIRRLLDLDAQPEVIDAHLEQGGLAALVAGCRGMRVPGAFDAFEVAFATLLRGPGRVLSATGAMAPRVVRALGEPTVTGDRALTHLAPTAASVAGAGIDGLRALGVPPGLARIIVSVARAMAEGRLPLDAGHDVAATRRALMAIEGVGDGLATTILTRALYWPDALPLTDRALQRAAGTSSASELRGVAERWRPWRAYAALHLRRKLEHDSRTSASMGPPRADVA